MRIRYGSEKESYLIIKSSLKIAKYWETGNLEVSVSPLKSRHGNYDVSVI